MHFRHFLLGGYSDMPGILVAIRQAGVERVVLLSSRSVVGGRPDNAIVNVWMASEAAVRSSGVSWTILEPSGFMSNGLRWAPQVRAGDLIRAPFADAPIAAIDPADIAAVAALALTSSGHDSRTYVLTGPEAIRLSRSGPGATRCGSPSRNEQVDPGECGRSILPFLC
jgi:uncharacterized protein YbjT (DUF2867 family)